jgi:beta-lactamase regulating signal transducer with metallopeptidase domain
MSIQNLPLEWLALADAVAKATVILAAAAAASFLFRRASAAFRHLVWTLALCGVLALPLFSAALPKWHVPLVTVAPAQAVMVMDEAAPPSVHAPPPRRTHAEPAAPVAAAPPADTQPSPAPRSPASLASALTWPQALLAIWFFGVVTVVARLAVGLAAVYWLSRRTQVITDAAWLPLARTLAAEMGVSPRLRFLRSTRASMPVAAGIFRPSIIMPADAGEWTESRLRIVLLHELAHVKRRDCLTHLIAQTACALYWFNPLTWLAAKRARTERERACDDLVLAFGTHGPDYADQLLWPTSLSSRAA